MPLFNALEYSVQEVSRVATQIMDQSKRIHDLIPKKDMHRQKRVVVSQTSSSDGEPMKEDNKNLEKDLLIIAKRLADLQNVQNPECNEASFVNGVRSSIETSRLAGADYCVLFRRLQLMESFFVKVAELDREVLRKTTSPSENQGQLRRRGSGNADMITDLFHMPTHFKIIDRLIDYYAIIKREETSNFRVIRTISDTKCTTCCTLEENQGRYQNSIKSLESTILQLQNDLMNAHNETNENKLLCKELEIRNKNLISESQAQKANFFSTSEVSLQVVEKQKIQIANLEELLMKKEVDTRNTLASLEKENKDMKKKMIELEERYKEKEFLCEKYKNESTQKGDNLSRHEREIAEAQKSYEDKVLQMESRLQESSDCYRACVDMNSSLKLQIEKYRQEGEVREREWGCVFEKMTKEIAEAQMKGNNRTQNEISSSTSAEDLEYFKGIIKRLEGELEDMKESTSRTIGTLTCQVTEYEHAFLDADDKRRDAEFMQAQISNEIVRANDLNKELKKKLADLAAPVLAPDDGTLVSGSHPPSAHNAIPSLHIGANIQNNSIRSFRNTASNVNISDSFRSRIDSDRK